jgi:hypothetical protein
VEEGNLFVSGTVAMNEATLDNREEASSRSVQTQTSNTLQAAAVSGLLKMDDWLYS